MNLIFQGYETKNTRWSQEEYFNVESILSIFQTQNPLVSIHVRSFDAKPQSAKLGYLVRKLAGNNNNQHQSYDTMHIRK